MMKPFWRMFSRNLVIVCIWIAGICPSLSCAQSPAAIARGLQWLSAQVQNDGTLLNEANSIATPFQCRAEAGLTLGRLSTLPASLGSSIEAEGSDNTQYVARKLMALAGSASDSGNAAALLLQRQNTDGGFGAAAEYGSDSLSTAWAILALAGSGQAAAMPAERARGYLAGRVGTDGSVVDGTDFERIYSSSLVLAALQTGNGNEAAQKSLANWLLQRQAGDGGWLGSTFLTAFASSAVLPLVADFTTVGNSRQFLLAHQAGDGSWDADPYLTALVLRTLSMRLLQPADPALNNANLRARVLDRAGGSVLPGVSITLSSLINTANRTLSTDQSGSFVTPGLPAGLYSLSAARAGYDTLVLASVPELAGQTLDLGDLLMLQTNNAVIVRGQVMAAGSAAPLPGVAVALSGASSAGTVTDGNGRYELTGVRAGSLQLTASLNGYQNSQVSLSAQAGQTVTFSPQLYRTGETPPAGTAMRFQGKVMQAGQALAGVALQVGGNPAGTTDGGGNFNVALAAGTATVSFSLSGYAGAQQTVAGQAGSVVDAGIINLLPLRTSSVINGRVLNGANAAIAGATVQLVGTSRAVKALGDGSFSLDGLGDGLLTVRVSAAGFDSQVVNFQLLQPEVVARDFTLVAQTGGGGWSLSEPVVQAASVGSSTDVVVTSVLSNTGSVSAAILPRLQVLDSSNRVAGYGRLRDADNHETGALTLAAGQSLPIRLVWNSARFAPGDYTLAAGLIEAGSVTQATPKGNLILERRATVSITAQAHFQGGVTADPPAARAGTNTSIKLLATLQNDGNIPIAAQPYTLTVLNAQDNSLQLSRVVQGRGMLVGEVMSLALGDWTPPATGAQYRLELVAADSAPGKLTGSVYIGDIAKATYSVNKQLVPAGTQTIQATLQVSGQDVVSGTISDPLSPLIKAAIKKAVAFNYSLAVSDTLATKCLRCHVQAQALVGGELTRRFTDDAAVAASRDTILNALTTHVQSNGAIDGYGSFLKTQSMLGMWALNAWHNKPEVISALAKGGEYLTTVQNANGSWSTDYEDGWWRTDTANTAFNLKNLVDIAASIKAAPPGSAVSYGLQVRPVAGLNDPFHLTSDAAGNVYVCNYRGGEILQLKPDGSTVQYMSGLTFPTALVFAADGTPWVSTLAGLYRRNPDGSATRLSGQPGSGMAIGPDGNFYMSYYYDNKIVKVTPQGVVSDFVSGAVLNNPWALAFDAAGNLLVANYTAQNILRFRPDATMEVAVPWTAGEVRSLQLTARGLYVTTETGLFLYNNDGHAERLTYAPMGGVAVLADGSVFVSARDNTIARLTSGTLDTGSILAKIDASIATASTWMEQDANTPNDKTLGLAQRLIGLGAAKNYYQGQARADSLQTLMQTVAGQLRALVNLDGGWGPAKDTPSDSLVTAQVGVALDTLHPSPNDPMVQNAVTWLLGRQQDDGSWRSETNIMATPLATTTWVSIWLPVVLDRLGAIDTDLNLTFPARIAMSNPDLAPASVAVNADGSSTAVWHLIGVTGDARALHFDLTLSGLAVNEVLPVSGDAHLALRNSFTGGVVNVPISIPAVTASAFMSLAVSTDQANYAANTLVNISALVSNTGLVVTSGSVRLEVLAPDNALVATLPVQSFADLAAAAGSNLAASWNTGTLAAGQGYRIRATLLDGSGNPVAVVPRSFNITGVAGSAGLGVGIRSDKQIYAPSDTVSLLGRLSNLSANTAQNDLRIVLTVKNPDGSLRLSKTDTLNQLLPNALKEYASALPLNFAAPGVYGVNVSVNATDGALLAQASTQFTVSSSAGSGSGLTGQIRLDPAQVRVGEALVIAWSVNNGGNAALANLPLSVTLLEPQSQRVIASMNSTQNLALGGRYDKADSWTAGGTPGDVLVALLSANVGGKSLPLAQANVTILPPQVKLEITQATEGWQNLLVLSRCKRAAEELLGQCGAVALPVEDQAKLAACDLDRANALDKVLTAAGVAHTVTSSVADFRQRMRSGLYNTFWISNGATSLRELSADQLRAAVLRGDGLLIDGPGDGRNRQLLQCAGVNYVGKFAPADQTLSMLDVLFPLGTYRITAAPVQLQVRQGSSQAKLGNSAGIVSGLLGDGKSLVFGFDWADVLRTQASDVRWNDVVRRSFAYLKPVPHASSVWLADEVFALSTVIRNPGSAIELQVQQSLPPGAQVVNTGPPAQLSGTGNGVATWRMTLASGASTTLQLRLRAPRAAGSASITTAINTIKDTAAIPYQTMQYGFTVRSSSELLTQLQADVSAFAAVSEVQRSTRSLILDDLNRCQKALGLSHFDEVVRRMLTVQTRLARIDSNGVLTQAVARLIATVEVQSSK